MNRQFALKMIGIALLLICLSSLAVNAESAPPATPMLDEELICNGDFETLECWSIYDDGLPSAAYSKAIALSGSQSMRLGLINQDGVCTYAAISQEVTIPEKLASATLSFWYFPLYWDRPIGYDYQVVVAYQQKRQPLAWAMPRTPSDNRRWVWHSVNLTSYKGKTITLSFYVCNNGSDKPETAAYLDDVSIQVSQIYRVHLPLIARQ